MLFSLKSQLSILAVLAATASAVTLQAYQGTCGIAPSVFAQNVPANLCVSLPTSGAVGYTNVPPGATGQTYFDGGCTNFSQGGGSGTYCLGQWSGVHSANWFIASNKLVRREPYTGEMTTGVEYTTPEGKRRRIAALADQWDHLLALAANSDWEALNAYPECKPSAVHV